MNITIPTPNLGRIPDPGPGSFRFSVMLSTPVADSKLIGPLVDKWEHRGAVDPGQQQTNIRVVLQIFFSKCSTLSSLPFLFVPSILAALSREEMASALIAAEDTGTLEKTFKKYEKEQDDIRFVLGTS